MALFTAARTSISFCTDMSSMVLGAMLADAVVYCTRCTFVFVFSFLSQVFAPDWVRSICGMHSEGECRERRLRSLSEDGAHDVQTCAARCGERGESRMVHPLCTNRTPPLEGPMRGREDLR
jgi:hypothetical protein